MLAALQTDLTSSTWKIVAFPHTSVFSSPVLRNSLEQLVPSTFLGPTALTTPISARLDQLLRPSGALAYLQLRAQRLLLQSYAISFGTAGSMWAAWATNYVDQGAALGLGALGVVGGARWAVGKWEKARRRWWEDWDRVGDGLERDTKVRVRILGRRKLN